MPPVACPQARTNPADGAPSRPSATSRPTASRLSGPGATTGARVAGERRSSSPAPSPGRAPTTSATQLLQPRQQERRVGAGTAVSAQWASSTTRQAGVGGEVGASASRGRAVPRTRWRGGASPEPSTPPARRRRGPGARRARSRPSARPVPARTAGVPPRTRTPCSSWAPRAEHAHPPLLGRRRARPRAAASCRSRRAPRSRARCRERRPPAQRPPIRSSSPSRSRRARGTATEPAMDAA